MRVSVEGAGIAGKKNLHRYLHSPSETPKILKIIDYVEQHLPWKEQQIFKVVQSVEFELLDNNFGNKKNE